jgi:hypothetical protein
MLPSGMLGEVGLVSGGTRDEFNFHSPGLRHANVTAITGAYFTLDISPRMNGVVKVRKHLGGIRVTNCAPSSAIYARLLVAKEKKPAAFIEFGPPHSRSRRLVRGGALADGERWSIKKGHHRFVALAIWLPDKTLAKTCADFSDLEIGPDGYLYLLSDKSSTIARLDDLPAGGGTAALLDARRLGDLDGKPEGLAFTAQGRAIVGLDVRKPRRNLVLLDPAIAQLRGRGK